MSEVDRFRDRGDALRSDPEVQRRFTEAIEKGQRVQRTFPHRVVRKPESAINRKQRKELPMERLIAVAAPNGSPALVA